MLSLNELNTIKKIAEEVGTEYFTLSQSNESGIGNILTMTYDTFVAEYAAKITIEIAGVEDW
jgi:hypothetical protein